MPSSSSLQQIKDILGAAQTEDVSAARTALTTATQLLLQRASATPAEPLCSLSDKDLLLTLLYANALHHTCFASHATSQSPPQIIAQLIAAFSALPVDVGDYLHAHFKALHTILQAEFASTEENHWQKSHWLPVGLRWVVCSLKVQHFHERVGLLMPMVLRMLEDYQIENKAMAIECIHHIFAHADPSELYQQGRADVLSHALERCLDLRDEMIVRVLFPALIAVLPVLEPWQRDHASKGNVSHSIITIHHITLQKSDLVFQRVLQNMIYEDKLVVRSLFVGFLNYLVQYAGVSTARHLRTLLPLLYTYITDTRDAEASSLALKTLNAVILHCWPCIAEHCGEIVSALVLAHLSDPNHVEEMQQTLILLDKLVPLHEFASELIKMDSRCQVLFRLQ